MNVDKLIKIQGEYIRITSRDPVNEHEKINRIVALAMIRLIDAIVEGEA